MKESFRDLLAVQARLMKEVGTVEVQLRTSNQHQFLNVDVVNSPLRNLPSGEKRAKALEIARLGYRSYASRSRLTGVSVTFGEHKTYFGFFHYNNTTDSFGFQIPELTEQGSFAER